MKFNIEATKLFKQAVKNGDLNGIIKQKELGAKVYPKDFTNALVHNNFEIIEWFFLEKCNFNFDIAYKAKEMNLREDIIFLLEDMVDSMD